MTGYVIVNHPLYQDAPPMPFNGERDRAELIAEVLAAGVPRKAIKVQKTGR